METVITGDDISPVGLISPGTYLACQQAVQGEDVLNYLRNLDETDLDNDFKHCSRQLEDQILLYIARNS